MSADDRFLYELAEDLGHSNPDWMAATMPAHVYNNWRALRCDPLNPRGAARTDWHFAHLAWSIWESQRARGEHQDVSDYLLRFVSPEQESVVQERQTAMQEAELKARFEERKIKEYLRDKRR